MTFSVVARSADNTHFGVAVASKFLAVGAVVPAARAGVGALATQALANIAYRDAGLDALAAGRGAQETVDLLTAADPGAVHRQLGVVDGSGGSASYTGAECMDWAGGRHGDGYAIQGNILTGPEVVAAMEEAWLATDPSRPLSRRLLAALAAGDVAGGDSRGRQSAALYVVTPGGGYGGGTDVLVDLRVDDSPTPVPELARLLDIHDLLFGRPDPEKLLALEGELADRVGARLTGLGFPPGATDAAALDKALATWAGRENFEERLVAGKIDPLVLEQLLLGD
jgi:uncharacterized Ntn-hydrolase superfamily protein